MNKFFILFVFLIIAGFQTYSLNHAAQYAFEPHEHGAVTCQFYVYQEQQSDILDSASAYFTELFQNKYITLQFAEIELVLSGYKTFSRTRAPPLFS